MIMSGIISLDIIPSCCYNRIQYYTSTVYRNACSLLCLYSGPNHLSKWSNSSFVSVPATCKNPLLGILVKLLLGFGPVEKIHWKSWICNRNFFLTYIAWIFKKHSHSKNIWWKSPYQPSGAITMGPPPSCPAKTCSPGSFHLHQPQRETQSPVHLQLVTKNPKY